MACRRHRAGAGRSLEGADHGWALLLLLESTSSCADARAHLSKVTFLLLCLLPAGSPGPTLVPQAPIALTTTPASLKGSLSADGAQNCPEFQNLDTQPCVRGRSQEAFPAPSGDSATLRPHTCSKSEPRGSSLSQRAVCIPGRYHLSRSKPACVWPEVPSPSRAPTCLPPPPACLQQRCAGAL